MEKFKKVVSMLLCFVLLAGILPVSALGTDAAAPGETTDAVESTTEPVTTADDTENTESTEPSEEAVVPLAADYVLESETAKVEGSSTTTYTPEEANVYKLVATPEVNKQYLIVNSNTGAGYGLDGDSSGYAVSTFTGGEEYYSSWDVDSNTGTQWVSDGGTYALADAPYLWTVGSGLTFSNGSTKLGTSGYLASGHSINFSTSSNWTYADNKLTTLVEGIFDDYTYTLVGGNNWSVSNSSNDSVYFYEPVTTIIKVIVETNVVEPGQWVVAGTDVTNAEAYEGNTVTLGSTLTWDPETGDNVDYTDAGVAHTYEVVTTKGDPSVISGIENGVATLSGVAGTAVVKVTYTSGDLVAWDEFEVTAVNPVYSIQINALSTNIVKIGKTQALIATVMRNSTDISSTATGLEWSSSNESIATVDPETGVVTGVAVGDVTITVTWTDPLGNEQTAEVALEVVDKEYAIDIIDPDAEDASITETIVVKGVAAGQTDRLGVNVTADGESVTDLDTAKVTFESSNIGIATVDNSGNVTFTGGEGTVTITARYQYADGKYVEDTVTYSVSKSEYSIPSDGTEDFPAYPNEGAIRYDKNAVAVGNFSQTGVAKVELSMTGVPYSTDNEIDVVIMVDMSTSMTKDSNNVADRVTPARNAANDALAAIVQNTDDNINNSRVAVYTFNGYDQGSTSQSYANAVDEVLSLQSYQNPDDKSDISRLTAAQTEITNWIQESNTDSGTNYGAALEKCYSVLKAAKEEYPDRKQYVIFVTDGEPTTGFAYETDDGGVADDGYNSNYQNGAADKYYTYTEYYSKQMKAAGVEIYTVGIQLTNDNANTILKKIAGNSTGDAYNNSTTHGSYAQFIEATESVENLKVIFTNIVNAIKQAATDVIVADQITDDYTMIFDVPTGSVDISGNLAGQEFYIEVTDYALTAVTDADGTITDYVRGTATSLCKLYLSKSNGTYFAASDASGTAYAAPVFEAKAVGSKYYWTADASKSTDGISVVSGETTYYFTNKGDGTHNMTSGAYAYGTVNATNTSTDLILATPYFVYNADNKMLYWTAEKLSNSELALSYFVYLDNSATEVGQKGETEPGTYATNVEATLTYTNYLDNRCQQEFPVPQLTWKGAQVSYVFYLVNEAGQPVNRAGRVIPFSEAVYVTDVYTESVVWNDTAGVTSLNAAKLAEELVPDVYDLYDEAAYYEIDVYQNTTTTNKDHFIIEGSAENAVNPDSGRKVTNINTTKVFNTKAGDRYEAYGAYSNTAGTYTSLKSGTTYTATVTTGFDYCNTTVAFAVVWTQSLTADAVVVDYGLDVVIDVTANDTIASSVIGVRADAPTGVEPDNGQYSTPAKYQTVTLDSGATASVESLTSVRFSQNDMEFSVPEVFYYEANFEYHDGTTLTEGNMYSSVTVIPATTIYYEEDFLTLESYTLTENDDGTTTATKDETSAWVTDGTTVSDTQDQDRPGASQISAAIDADNNYGYDSAYETMATHSLGSGAKITVDATHYGEAHFTFWGTGFDVISLTSNTTGTITVKVYNAAGETVKSGVVDTYYGMNADASLSVNNPNTIYQVPVIKFSGLEYGQYTVKITAGYGEFFDHNGTGSYDLYLDAVRIYDPTGNVNDEANAAYVKDGEAFPVYEELRDNIIAASNYAVTENEDGTVTVTGENLSGAIFIDCADATTSIADYVSYGPNNELYLANNQAIAFNVAVSDIVADVQLGIKVANGDSVTYEINGVSHTVNSATDMYYSILEYAKAGTVTIKNVSGGILSLTNIKVTHTQATTTTASLLSMDAESAGFALMSLRSAPVVEEPEETVPETTVPEETEPETTVPEETEPETTVPEETEPETTVPEETEPEQGGSVVGSLIDLIGKLLGWIFG